MSRDAERSRAAILEAGRDLFAERGYEATSLAAVAAAAGLSRGTPSYFFGSKERLYAVVLERAFTERERAAGKACEPLHAWVAAAAGSPLDEPMEAAVDGYLGFLLDNPAFLKLLQREELAGASRLHAVPRESRAIAAAFEAVRSVARQRDLREFKVEDAVLLFISLTFSPLSQRSTFLAALGRDLADRRVRRNHVRLVADQLLYLVGA